MSYGIIRRKIKTVIDTVIAGYSRIPVVTEGVSAPTTSTVGNVGDVVVDVNGNRWTMSKIVGGLYYWEKNYTQLVLTQIQYDSITIKDPNTIYIIEGVGGIINPIIGIPPTTSTIGYLGEVRFDSNGNRWEMLGVVGGLYYWALPIKVFPSNNTEYVAYIDNGVVVYKMLRVANADSVANTTLSSPHGIPILTPIQAELLSIAGVCLSGNTYSTTSYYAWIRLSNTSFDITVGSGGGFPGSQYKASLLYTKVI